MGAAFSKGGLYSRYFLEGAQPLFFSLGHCAHLIGRNRQQGCGAAAASRCQRAQPPLASSSASLLRVDSGARLHVVRWPSFAQAVIRCNGGGALNSLIQGKPNGLIAKYKNLWVTTLLWMLHQWCPNDAFHMAWRTFQIRDIYMVRGIAAIGEGAYKARASVEACDGARKVYGKTLLGEIIAGTVVATGGTILLAMVRPHTPHHTPHTAPCHTAPPRAAPRHFCTGPLLHCRTPRLTTHTAECRLSAFVF
jgi:hypothetical protein